MREPGHRGFRDLPVMLQTELRGGRRGADSSWLGGRAGRGPQAQGSSKLCPWLPASRDTVGRLMGGRVPQSPMQWELRGFGQGRDTGGRRVPQASLSSLPGAPPSSIPGAILSRRPRACSSQSLPGEDPGPRGRVDQAAVRGRGSSGGPWGAPSPPGPCTSPSVLAQLSLCLPPRPQPLSL